MGGLLFLPRDKKSSSCYVGIIPIPEFPPLPPEVLGFANLLKIDSDLLVLALALLVPDLLDAPEDRLFATPEEL
jgi:hypothetical protein